MAVARIYTMSCAPGRGEELLGALEALADALKEMHGLQSVSVLRDVERADDFVLVEKTRTAREGEIVVALVDGSDATLKRFYREGDQIRLQPSNAEMAPIYAPAANVAIQGKVLGILRKYA